MADAASSPYPWPPVIYGGAALLAGFISWLAPWPFGPGGTQWLQIGIGIAVLGIGVGLLLLAGLRFNAAGTPIPPHRPTKSIVSGGIYGHTRNPMYLGMSLGLAGLGIAVNQLWFLLALPIAVYAVTKLAIEREEAYLAAKFGPEYLAYKARVRRWL